MPPLHQHIHAHPRTVEGPVTIAARLRPVALQEGPMLRLPTTSIATPPHAIYWHAHFVHLEERRIPCLPSTGTPTPPPRRLLIGVPIWYTSPHPPAHPYRPTTYTGSPTSCISKRGEHHASPLLAHPHNPHAVYLPAHPFGASSRVPSPSPHPRYPHANSTSTSQGLSCRAPPTCSSSRKGNTTLPTNRYTYANPHL